MASHSETFSNDSPDSESDATASGETSLVELRDVAKVYPGGAQALEDFTCRISPGEFVCLLGASGCGKSTVLRLVAGLAEPTTGVVHRRWNSAEQDAASAKSDRPVGCVFQEPTLLPWSRVWDNVYLPLRLQGLERQAAAERVDAAIERVGLTEFAHAYPRELSGGMKMRAAVARATVTSPQLLMLDEPFAALDEITRFRLNDDLLNLWSEQRWAVLFVTHSVYESVFLSSRVMIMSRRPGRVQEEIPIPLPYPRNEATRSSSQYVELCGQVSEALRRSIAEEMVSDG